MDLNIVALTGRLGRDPETRFTSNGDAVANFSIAVDSGFGDRKKTSWIKIVAWKKTAEAVQKYLHKGSRVAVSGFLQERTWEKEGQKRSSIEVVANAVAFIDGTKAQEGNNDTPATEDDSEIPF